MPTTTPSPRSRPNLTPTARLGIAVSPQPGELRRVRHEMEKALVEWGLTDVVDTVLLLVSELVTNAVQHAPHAGIGFAATQDEGLLLIEVQDGSSDPPVPRHEPADIAESGRGLDLVDSLADDWGWMPHADGTKSTWALITVPPAVGLPTPWLPHPGRREAQGQ